MKFGRRHIEKAGFVFARQNNKRQTDIVCSTRLISMSESDDQW